jgi:hypothetical protein
MVLLLANSALLPYGDDRKERAKRSVWPGSHVLLLAAMAFIMMLSEGSMLDWSAVFLVDKAGMIDKNAGIGYTVFSTAMTTSRLGGNLTIQRLGRKWTISAGALVAAGGFCLLTSLANPTGTIFGFAMIGLGAADVVPLIFSLASESGGALGTTSCTWQSLDPVGSSPVPSWSASSRIQGDLGSRLVESPVCWPWLRSQVRLRCLIGAHDSPGFGTVGVPSFLGAGACGVEGTMTVRMEDQRL